MSLLQKIRKTEMTPRTIILSMSVFVLAVAGALTLVVKLLAGSPAGDAASAPSRFAVPAQLTTTLSVTTAKAATTEKLASEERDYTVIATRNLFRSRAMTIATVPPPKIAKAPLTTGTKVFQPTSSEVAPFKPTAAAPTQPQVAFTGAVDIAGQRYALLESLEDHLSQYTRIGSTAFGYKLLGIAEHSVTLEANGETLVLNIGDNKEEEKITPATPAVQQNNATPNGTAQPNGMPPGFVPGGGFRQRRQQAQTTGGG